MESYDFIIAGGGAAGLSLAHHLAHGPLGDRSILIVDRSAKDRNDRTWCFWTDRPTCFDGIVYRSWDSLRFAAEDFQRTIPLAPYRYQMIRGIDFYRFVQQDLAARPNVEFLQGTVQRIEDHPNKVRVWVDGSEVQGRWAFDSRFDCSRPGPPRPGYHRLLQQFRGYEIETPESRFDPSTPTFLDFRTPQNGHPRFFYLLPLSERRALVEYVACSPDPLLPGEAEAAFEGYVGAVLGIDSYQILAREGGVSPMTDQPFPRRIGQSVLTIGVGAGRIKPSTGFAFTRIQQDSAAIVRSLSQTGHPFDLPPDSRRYRLCDSLMLQIMSRHGDQVKRIFAALFENNPIQRVLRFLDEAGSPWESLQLISSLPDPIFLQALLRVGVLRTIQRPDHQDTKSQDGRTKLLLSRPSNSQP